MQIKQPMLAQHLRRKINPIHILIGAESFLIEESMSLIKSTIKKDQECDEKTLYIQSTTDWSQLIEEAYSYSLFADTLILTVFYDKKTIDAAAKKTLTQYLEALNTRCFIIIRAPEVPAKQLLWLSQHDAVLLVVSYNLTPEAMKQWIVTQFKKNTLNFESSIPDLIYQYTQGNMLACAQLIEKIALVNPAHTLITPQKTLEQVSDQSQHTLFELVDNCLLGYADKAIHILRQAAQNKTESTLVLWMLTQEVRLILQLSYSILQKVDFKSACSQLKIWPQRTNLYHSAIKRVDRQFLEQLLHFCNSIDEQIKTNLNAQVWNSLEQLALALCLGKSKDSLCIL